MRWIHSLLWFWAVSTVAQSTEGLYNLVQRRLPNHIDKFQFELTNYTSAKDRYDEFLVQTTPNGTVLVQGNTISALSSG